MDKDDKQPLVTFGDVPAALGLLSRLPVPVDFDAAQKRGPAAAWAYPLAGLVLAGLAGLIAVVAARVGVPSELTSALALACLVIMTGAMHEDGLADSADGLWGGWDRDRRLAIMKDSHIGAYGVMALILGLLIRWQALTLIVDAGQIWTVLISVACLSRSMMVPVMAGLPHARDTGLSHSVGRPGTGAAVIAVGLGMLLTLALFGGAGVVLCGIAVLSACGCAAIARAKIQGQTGDILGATQQITEISLLVTAATMLVP